MNVNLINDDVYHHHGYNIKRVKYTSTTQTRRPNAILRHAQKISNMLFESFTQTGGRIQTVVKNPTTGSYIITPPSLFGAEINGSETYEDTLMQGALGFYSNIQYIIYPESPELEDWDLLFMALDAVINDFPAFINPVIPAWTGPQAGGLGTYNDCLHIAILKSVYVHNQPNPGMIKNRLGLKQNDFIPFTHNSFSVASLLYKTNIIAVCKETKEKIKITRDYPKTAYIILENNHYRPHKIDPNYKNLGIWHIPKVLSKNTPGYIEKFLETNPPKDEYLSIVKKFMLKWTKGIKLEPMTELEDEIIADTYKSAIIYRKEAFNKTKAVEKFGGYILDVNSMYPYIMQAIMFPVVSKDEFEDISEAQKDWVCAIYKCTLGKCPEKYKNMFRFNENGLYTHHDIKLFDRIGMCYTISKGLGWTKTECIKGAWLFPELVDLYKKRMELKNTNTDPDTPEKRLNHLLRMFYGSTAERAVKKHIPNKGKPKKLKKTDKVIGFTGKAYKIRSGTRHFKAQALGRCAPFITGFARYKLVCLMLEQKDGNFKYINTDGFHVDEIKSTKNINDKFGGLKIEMSLEILAKKKAQLKQTSS